MVISEKPLKYARGMNPNSRKNLNPGFHGQGNGQNGYSLTSRLKNSLTKPLVKPADDAPAGDHLVYATLKAAIETKAVPFMETWNRAEGKLKEPDKPQYNDNRQYNFVVLGDENKQKLQQLLSGEKPKTIEATR